MIVVVVVVGGVGVVVVAVVVIVVVTCGGGAVVASSNPIPNRNSPTQHPTHQDSNSGSSVMLWHWSGVGRPDLLL